MSSFELFKQFMDPNMAAKLAAENEALYSYRPPLPLISKSGRTFIKDTPNGRIDLSPRLQVILLGVPKNPNGSLRKSRAYYAEKYDPKKPAGRPTCAAGDGQTPDPEYSTPQAASCAVCPWAAFGSAKDEHGAPRKGCACPERVQLPVFLIHADPVVRGPHMLSLAPTSIAPFQQFIKAAHGVGWNEHDFVTTIFLPPGGDYAVLEFGVGETQPNKDPRLSQSMPKLAQLITSIRETDAGTREILGLTTLTMVALPAPTSQVALPPPPPPTEPPVLAGLEDMLETPPPAPTPALTPAPVKRTRKPATTAAPTTEVLAQQGLDLLEGIAGATSATSLADDLLTGLV